MQTDDAQKKRMEHKDTSLEIKQTSEGIFSGYAALFNKADIGNDIILPGAFKASLRRIGPSKIKMLYQHDPGDIIGEWTTVREDSTGLYVEGRIFDNPNIPASLKTKALIDEGAIDGLSIGYRIKDFSYERKRNGMSRIISAVDLLEISVVTFPMQREARVTEVRMENNLWVNHEVNRLNALLADINSK